MMVRANHALSNPGQLVLHFDLKASLDINKILTLKIRECPRGSLWLDLTGPFHDICLLRVHLTTLLISIIITTFIYWDQNSKS